MDRVLLIIDDIQYSRHLEMTLRKVGFDVESINNEFNISESILSYNPNYVISRGTSSRLSSLNVGKKLKDAGSKFNAKSILIFPSDFKLEKDDAVKIKSDLLLFEPISTLKLAMHVLTFSGGDFEFIKEKLLKFAITDNQFRSYEQQILKNAGITIDAEIQIVSGMEYVPPADQAIDGALEWEAQETEYVISDEKKSVKAPEIDLETNSLKDGELSDKPLFPQPEELSPEVQKKIQEELAASEMELPLRIDSYDHASKAIEMDPDCSLKKKQTKKAANQMRQDLINEKLIDIKTERLLEEEKIRFAQALFKKKS